MQISYKILKPDTKIVVLDLDGTLYSKHGMVKHMMASAILEWKMMLIERKTRKQLRGIWKGDKDSFYHMYFATMAQGHLFSQDYAKWWYETRYMPLMVKVIQKWHKPVEWLLPFVHQCKELGVRIVVLSDYGHAKEKIQALGLDESIFDWVISAPELGGLKPAAELMNRVAAKMGVQPHQCLVIGDRDDTDGELARSVNAPFFIVNQ
jgi:FMN phosphatase YigB (HAD superfamily)